LLLKVPLIFGTNCSPAWRHVFCLRDFPIELAGLASVAFLWRVCEGATFFSFSLSKSLWAAGFGFQQESPPPLPPSLKKFALRAGPKS
jgi:hypothetical protein